MHWKSISKPCKKLLISSGSASSGRNSAGRITIWHRGGGSKRLIRNVDLKRNTPSVGIVERIEYDPNRSSNIALVRWTEGVQPNKTKDHFTPAQRLVPKPITTTVSGQFPLACLTANPRSDQNPVRGKHGGLKDVFISAFAPSGQRDVSSLNIPRIAVAGAMPFFFAPQTRGEVKAGEEMEFSLSDVRKWNKDSVLWAHRSKRKAAVSWQSLGGRAMSLGFVENDDDKKKSKSVQGRLVAKPTGKTPISYILASHELQVGQMVMNCDSTNPSPKQNAY